MIDVRTSPTSRRYRSQVNYRGVKLTCGKTAENDAIDPGCVKTRCFVRFSQR